MILLTFIWKVVWYAALSTLLLLAFQLCCKTFQRCVLFQFRLEPIGAAASKEYSLVKAIEKMKQEWANMQFSLTKYRDTVSKHQIYMYILWKGITLILSANWEIIEGILKADSLWYDGKWYYMPELGQIHVLLYILIFGP